MSRPSCLVIEDHDLMATGVVGALERHDLVVAARAATIAEAARGPAADVMLLDLGLPDVCRLQTVCALLEAFPGARILVMTATHNVHDALLALRGGARGFVAKDIRPPLLADALATVAAGSWAIDPAVAEALLESRIDDKAQRQAIELLAMGLDIDAIAATMGVGSGDVDSLVAGIVNRADRHLPTPAQLRVLVLVAAGLSNEAVAAALSIRAQSVERHLQSLRERMNLPRGEMRPLSLLAHQLHGSCHLTTDDHVRQFAGERMTGEAGTVEIGRGGPVGLPLR